MIKILAILLTFFINSALFSPTLSAKIIEAHSLETIEHELSSINKDSLVVFDVDFTLIVPKDRILSPGGENYIKEFISQHPEMKQQEVFLTSIVMCKSQVTLVNNNILDLLNDLKKRNIKVIALTAIPTGKFGIIDNLEDWRMEQLHSFGICFNESFPSAKFLKFENFKGKPTTPVFKEGILASSKYPKGEVLVEFLKRMQWKPSHVYFIDDRMEFINSVEKELEKENICHTSFYYTEALEKYNTFNQEIADFQLTHLISQNEWLNDEETQEIINQNCSSY